VDERVCGKRVLPPAKRGFVPDVAFRKTELRVSGQDRQVPFLERPVVERVEVVQPVDTVTPEKEGFRDVGPDETGNSGNENRSGQEDLRGRPNAERAKTIIPSYRKK